MDQKHTPDTVKKPATWQFMIAALLFMGVGGGVTYWLQVSKLRAEYAAWVPVRPESKSGSAEVSGWEQRIRQGDAAALGELGVWYRENGHIEAALSCFSTVVGLDPRNPRWLVAAAEMEAGLDRQREAERRLTRARQMEIRDGELYRRIGRLAEIVGRQVDAKSDYERAVELDPTLAETWYRLIVMYRAIGDEGGARRALEAGLSANPDAVVLLMDRGTQLRRRGQWERARVDFARVVELAPDEPAGYHALAQTLFQIERAEEAEAILGEVLEKNPDDTTALALLCVEALVAGDRAAADRWYGRLRRVPAFQGTDRLRMQQAYRERFGEAPPELP